MDHQINWSIKAMREELSFFPQQSALSGVTFILFDLRSTIKFPEVDHLPPQIRTRQSRLFSKEPHNSGSFKSAGAGRVWLCYCG